VQKNITESNCSSHSLNGNACSHLKVKVKEADLYSAFIEVPYTLKAIVFAV